MMIVGTQSPQDHQQVGAVVLNSRLLPAGLNSNSLEDRIMFQLQYRELGTGEVAIYRTFWKFSWLVEVTDYRMYDVEAQINESLMKMQDLFAKHDALFDDVLSMKSKIQHDRQNNPYHSAKFDGSPPSNSSKYRSRRGRPINLWEQVRIAVTKAKSVEVMHDCVYTDDDVTIDMVGRSQQDIGMPQRQQQSRKQNQQHNQNQNNS